jgi:hypothetical protein
VREFGQAVDLTLDYVLRVGFRASHNVGDFFDGQDVRCVSASPSTPYGATEVVRDRRGL